MTDTQTDTYYLAGNLLRLLTPGSGSNAGYSLVETLTAPGAGAPPNRHPDDDEAFYVLDGRFDFTLEDETVEGRAGSFLRVPRGAIHAFRNAGTAPARMLILNAPGRVHDGFFREAGEPQPPGTRELPSEGPAPDIPRLLEIGRRHGIEFLLGPDPGA